MEKSGNYVWRGDSERGTTSAGRTEAGAEQIRNGAVGAEEFSRPFRTVFSFLARHEASEKRMRSQCRPALVLMGLRIAPTNRNAAGYGQMPCSQVCNEFDIVRR